MKILQNKRYRFIIRMSIALLIAFFLNYFYSFTHQCWLPLATFCVMLTKEGSAVYQGLVRLIQLAVGLALIFFLQGLGDKLPQVVYDVSIGAFLGLSMNSLFLPDRVDIDFRTRMSDILKKDKIYFSEIVTYLLKKNKKSMDKTQKLFFAVQKKLPIFVLETGFDTKLQTGHRYFLAKIIELNQTLLAMHRIAHFSFEKTLIIKIRKPLFKLEKKVIVLIEALMRVLHLKKLPEGIEDFVEEIENLEKKFTTITSLDTALLDTQKDYVYLVEFIYLLKDLREILLKCAAQMRSASSL